MNEIWKHLGLFLEIISFFSGIAVLTVNLVFCREKENRFYQILRRYHLAFLAYLLSIFSYYYMKQFWWNEKSIIVINILGNITLAYLCCSHARVIAFLNESEESKRYRNLIRANILYGAAWTTINVFWYDTKNLVNTQPGISVVWITETVLFSTLVLFWLGEWKERKKDAGFYFFMCVFGVEYLWETIYDLAIVETSLRFVFAANPFNIIIILHLLVNIMLLTGLYPKFLKKMMGEEEGKKVVSDRVEGEPIQSEYSQEAKTEKKLEKYSLTAREFEILQLLLDRKSNQEIAEMLFISNNTVKHHVSNIFKKTGVNKRTELQKLLKEGNSKV